MTGEEFTTLNLNFIGWVLLVAMPLFALFLWKFARKDKEFRLAMTLVIIFFIAAIPAVVLTHGLPHYPYSAEDNAVAKTQLENDYDIEIFNVHVSANFVEYKNGQTECISGVKYTHRHWKLVDPVCI